MLSFLLSLLSLDGFEVFTGNGCCSAVTKWRKVIMEKKGEIGSAVLENFRPDKTVVRALGLGGLLGGSDPACVDVKNGKIVRVRPMHFDWKYDRKTFNPWKFERNGKILQSNFKGMPPPGRSRTRSEPILLIAYSIR